MEIMVEKVALKVNGFGSDFQPARIKIIHKGVDIVHVFLRYFGIPDVHDSPDGSDLSDRFYLTKDHYRS